MRYPVILTPDDNGTVLVTMPDLPVVTYGEDEADALYRALDACNVIVAALRDDGKPIPAPSPITGPYVDIPGL